MKIGVLAAGAPPRALGQAFGDYPTMFQTLLAGHGYDWRVFDVRASEFPDAPGACDAYIVTGSSAGVYDPEPWIGELFHFLRATKGQANPQVVNDIVRKLLS